MYFLYCCTCINLQEQTQLSLDYKKMRLFAICSVFYQWFLCFYITVVTSPIHEYDIHLILQTRFTCANNTMEESDLIHVERAGQYTNCFSVCASLHEGD